MNRHDAPMDPMHCSPEAEEGVIGGILMIGAEGYDAVADLLRADSFAIGLYASTWKVIEARVLANKPVDVVSVYEALRADEPELDQPLVELHRCTMSYVGLRVLRQHAEIVAEKAVARALQRAAAEVRGIAADGSIPINDRIAQAQAALENVAQPAMRSQPQPIQAYVANAIDRIQALADGSVDPGIRTGIPSLDRRLGGGLKPGKQMILAARPSIGKSSLAEQIAVNLALDGHPAAIFSMEMENEEMTDRAICCVGCIDYERYQTGKLNSEEWAQFVKAVERMRSLPLYLDQQAAMTLPEIAAKARMLKRKHGIQLLVVDYIQLCASTNPKLSRHHQLEEISRGLKALAKQLGITILALSQLNREVEKRTSGRPVLADLKESGAIEEDADVVMLMWRHETHKDYMLNGLDVAKARGGRTGEVALHFEGCYQRWSESTKPLSTPEKKPASKPRYDPEF